MKEEEKEKCLISGKNDTNNHTTIEYYSAFLMQPKTGGRMENYMYSYNEIEF